MTKTTRKPLLVAAIPLLCIIGSIPVCYLTRQSNQTDNPSDVVNAVFAAKQTGQAELTSIENNIDPDAHLNHTLARLIARAHNQGGTVAVTKTQLKLMVLDLRAIRAACR